MLKSISGGGGGGGGGAITSIIAGTGLTGGGAAGAVTIGEINGYLLVALATGTTDNFSPGAGWPGTINRVDITLAAGAATLAGLVAGFDGQEITLFNLDTVNQLILSVAGSATPVNGFQGSGNRGLPPLTGQTLQYTAQGVNRWRFV